MAGLLLDVVRGAQPPFDPQAVMKGYAALLREYGLHEVTGDNYSAAWVETAFKDAGIKYVRSEKPKSALVSRSRRRCLRVAAFRCRITRCCCVSCGCWSGAFIVPAGTRSITAERVTTIMPMRCWPVLR